jgi:hypothetical protein
VDGAEVGVLKDPNPNQVSFGGFLKRYDSRALESKLSLLKSMAISFTSRWKGAFRMRNSVDFW